MIAADARRKELDASSHDCGGPESWELRADDGGGGIDARPRCALGRFQVEGALAEVRTPSRLHHLLSRTSPGSL